MSIHSPKSVLITGVLGFIGHHLAIKYLSEGYKVIGIDHFREDMSTDFKNHRFNDLRSYSFFHFQKIDIRDKKSLVDLFENHHFDLILHLAARTGVRESSVEYVDYLDTNVNGTCHLFDANIKQNCPMIFASSSSVYGDNSQMPFHENLKIDTPLSIYAASKAAAELLSYNYAKHYGMPITALRFFTVYGPWGRKDMAVYKFFKAINEGKEITLFNQGQLLRDFTYVDDIVESIYLLSKQDKHSTTNFEVYNIGNGQQHQVIDLVHEIEEALDKKATIKFEDKVAEDMDATKADVNKLYHKINFKPKTDLKTGILKTRDWFLKYP